MANKLIAMHKIRKIYSLHEKGLSKVKISQQLNLSRNTVKKYIRFLSTYNFSAYEMSQLTDEELSQLFQGGKYTKTAKAQELEQYFPLFEKELSRVGVSKHRLWKEYIAKHPDGLSYPQTCYYYRQWKKHSNPVMRFEHKAGDKLFLDYAGKPLHIINQSESKLEAVEVFVSVLGFSQLTYVEAVASQKKEDFISCTENALHFYSGVPACITTDNLKAAVHKSNKYEPCLNETFADFADHYNTTIIPTRSYKPRDKAIVENSVRIVYTRIYAVLRDRRFFSLPELNQAIREELKKHNDQPFRNRPYSRRDLFEETEKQALLPLPTAKYELKRYAYGTVYKNCHVFLNKDKHYYSVPNRFIGQKVKIIYSSTLVQIYYKYERIAVHKRDFKVYQYSTIAAHLPATHQFVNQWSAQTFIDQASEVGADCKAYMLKILDLKQHPEQSYKSCMGILSLVGKVGQERMNNACRRALDFEAYSYHTIKNILENGWDKLDDSSNQETPRIIPIHPNIRGKEYYQ